MNANFKISLYDTVKLRAAFDENQGHQWVTVYFVGKGTDELEGVTMFFDDRAVAKAYAAAINSVKVETAVPVDEQRAA